MSDNVERLDPTACSLRGRILTLYAILAAFNAQPLLLSTGLVAWDFALRRAVDRTTSRRATILRAAARHRVRRAVPGIGCLILVDRGNRLRFVRRMLRRGRTNDAT